MPRDAGMSPRAGTSQRDLAQVHNGRAPKEMWVTDIGRSVMSRGPVSRGEWRGNDDGALLSWSIVCSLERRSLVGLLGVGSYTRPDPGVSETNLAAKNKFARVRGGHDGHQACSRDWVDGI